MSGNRFGKAEPPVGGDDSFLVLDSPGLRATWALAGSIESRITAASWYLNTLDTHEEPAFIPPDEQFKIGISDTAERKTAEQLEAEGVNLLTGAQALALLKDGNPALAENDDYTIITAIGDGLAYPVASVEGQVAYPESLVGLEGEAFSAAQAAFEEVGYDTWALLEAA